MALIVLFAASVATAEVARSGLFEFNPGDTLEDSGVITIISPSSTRVETFETVRHKDGGWTTTSIIAAANGAYRVEGRWSYDAAGRSIRAAGSGAYEGMPIKVAITVQRPTATIKIDGGHASRSVSAVCSATCFVDLSPSVMAMFAVTRQFRIDSTKTKSFKWVGQALHVDRTLLEGGGSDVRLFSVHRHNDQQILQFVFLETLPAEGASGTTRATFDLYVDSNHRPLAFSSSGGTRAFRAGYEFITEMFPPSFAAAPGEQGGRTS